MKTLLRYALAGSLAASAAIVLPGAHATPTPTGVGCVAIGDPRPATPLDIVGYCDFVARGNTATYQTVAAHWQVLVNDHVEASGFGPLSGSVVTEPGDVVTAYVFPDCNHMCVGVGTVTLADGDESVASQ
jgi:hypothetical protein